MQGQGSMANSFTETIDLNQGSTTSNTGVNQSASWNSVLDPVESQVSSYTLSSANRDLAAVGQSAQNFSGWDFGESSSGANLQNHGIGYGLKMENGQSSSFCAYSGSERRIEERRFEPSNVFLGEGVSSGIGGNQFAGRPLILQSPSQVPRPINLNAGEIVDNHDIGLGMGLDACHNLYKLGGLEADHISTADTSLDNVGTSSGNFSYFVENDGGSGSSLGNWGSSCKRKALERSSGQYPGGSSSCFQQSENIARHNVPARYGASSSLNILSPPVNSPGINPEHLQPRIRIGLPVVTSDPFLPLGVTGVAEGSSRNFGARVNLGHHESGRFHVSSAGTALRQSDMHPSHQSSRALSFTDSMDARPTASLASSSSNPPNQSHSTHVANLSRNVPRFTWNGGLNYQGGGSLMSSGERGVSLCNEANLQGTSRNGMEHPIFFPGTESSSMVQDPNNWNVSTGNTSSSAAIPSGSRTDPIFGECPFPNAWISHHNSPAQHQPRLSEFTPWTLFPPIDSNSRAQRGQLRQVHLGSSASEETLMSSGSNQGHRSSFPRTALLMEVPGDDLNGWRALAADFGGRQRLVSEIRQVLNAMRSSENLRAEDHMLFDPFINGAAELHDRHRDMRLDVDNMSYEELLALEERIGNVNTGLSEETIMKSMQQQKFMSIESSSSSEPCCICQEEYVTGEDIGTLECGHDFHTNCIKQWLIIKNLCPICKMTALGT